MSVMLLIEEVDGNQVEISSPVSGQTYFDRVWMDICEKEGFEWIPLFQSGFSFTGDDLPYILEELVKFREACHKHLEDKEEQVYERLDLLEERLEPLKGKQSKFFIG